MFELSTYIRNSFLLIIERDKQMKQTTLVTVNKLQNELETISNQIGNLKVFDFDDVTIQRKLLGVQSDLSLVLKEFKVINSHLPKATHYSLLNENEIIRTEKGKTEFERSKKVEELRQQGNTTDMFKTMFGQD